MTPYRSSASQVSTFEDCARKWAFLKIEKIETPPNRFAAFGLKSHGYLEEWFTRATLPPAGKPGACARAILVHLPPPQTPGIDVEHEISIEIGGVPFKGFIDVRMLKRDPRPLVSDHKTTGNLKWALRPEDLPNDVQATIYALDTMDEAGVDAVDLQWTYATRDRARALPVLRTVTRDEIAPRIEKTAESVQAMKTLFENQTPALDIPPNIGACEKYGGCPFQDRCNLTPREKMRSIMEQEEKTAFFEKLQKRRNKNGTPTPTPDPETVAAVQAAPEPEPAAINPPEAPKKKRGRPKKAAPVVEAKPEPEARRHYTIYDLKMIILFSELERSDRTIFPARVGFDIDEAFDEMKKSEFFAGYRAGLEAGGKV